MKILSAVLASVVLLGAGSAAFAAEGPNAEQLRREARACEQPDGFLRALNPNAQDAVQTINAKRRTVYQQDATRENTQLAAVGVIYAEKIKSAPNYRACP